MKTNAPTWGDIKREYEAIAGSIGDLKRRQNELIISLCPYEPGDKLYLKAIPKDRLQAVDRVVVVKAIEPAPSALWQLSCDNENGEWVGRFEDWKICFRPFEEWRAAWKVEKVEPQHG